MCFGFPRHDRSAIERVKIHTDLRYELRFEQDQAFDLEYRETSGQRGLLYINALFYRVEPVRDAQDAARRGRAPAPYWDEAKREGRCWLDDNGYPVPGDGNQARMEQHIATWLAERGHEASEASVRRHVTAWIAEYRAEIGAG